MEQEITTRAILRSAWKSLQEKANHPIPTVESRAGKETLGFAVLRYWPIFHAVFR